MLGEVAALSRETLRERVSDTLRSLLIAGQFAPGEKLSLRSVADSLAVSMTPVREAVARLASHPTRPDLIVSDYRLRDGETGTEVIERLRSEFNETIPALIITGDTAPDRLIEARTSGLVLLHKPVPNGKLRAAMRNLMVGARAFSGE